MPVMKRRIGSAGLHPDHRVVVAAHAGIGQIGGAARQQLRIRGRHMGVGADTALARPSQKWPIAIFSDVASAWKSTNAACTCPPRGWARSTASMAENGSSKGWRMNTRPSTCATRMRRPPGASNTRAPRPAPLGDVERAQDARLGLDEGQHVLLVEGMIAQRHAIRAGRQQAAA
jgi:hypothetical protein